MRPFNPTVGCACRNKAPCMRVSLEITSCLPLTQDFRQARLPAVRSKVSGSPGGFPLIGPAHHYHPHYCHNPTPSKSPLFPSSPTSPQTQIYNHTETRDLLFLAEVGGAEFLVAMWLCTPGSKRGRWMAHGQGTKGLRTLERSPSPVIIMTSPWRGALRSGLPPSCFCSTEPWQPSRWGRRSEAHWAVVSGVFVLANNNLPGNRSSTRSHCCGPQSLYNNDRRPERILYLKAATVDGRFGVV